jgi:3-(3-hydroxy-phenyl)propionate hydroxylase
MIRLAKFMGQLVMPSSHAKAILVHGTMAVLRRIPKLRNLFDELGVKPQNAFTKGLFLSGGERVRRGAWLPQSRVRPAEGSIELSDEALGPALALVGLGVDVRPMLAERSLSVWSRAGGRTAHLLPRGQPATSGVASYEDLEGRIVPGAAPYGWCVVVRPDRTILHDGPAEDAERLVRESLELLGSPVS